MKEPFVDYTKKQSKELPDKVMDAADNAVSAMRDGSPESYDSVIKESDQIGKDFESETLGATKDEINAHLPPAVTETQGKAGEQVKDLFDKAESLHGKSPAELAKAAGRWAWVKGVAVVTAVAALFSFGVYSGGQQGSAARDMADRHRRAADSAVSLQEYKRQMRQYESQLQGIRLSREQFERFSYNIAQPVAQQPVPFTAVNIPSYVFTRPIEVTIQRPEQPTQHVATTVGNLVAQIPSPQKEAVEQTIRQQYQLEVHAPVQPSSGSPPPVKNTFHSIRVDAVDGNGVTFGSFRY